MTADDFIAKYLMDDMKKQLDEIGITDYEVKPAGRGQIVRPGLIEPPPLSLSLRQPQTVSQLCVFSRALHRQTLGVGTERVFVLATAPTATPIATVPGQFAADILMTMDQVTEAVKHLPYRPSVDSPVLQNKNFAEIIRLAELQRELEAAIGGQTIMRQRVKPGPQARTLEEAKEIVEKWRHWKKLGYSQQHFADMELCGSRKVLTSCISQCRNAFGNNFI